MGRVRKIYDIEWKKYLKCSICWELKEMSAEFWNKTPNSSIWFISKCKECVSKVQKEYYVKNAERKRKISLEYYNSHKNEIKVYREMTKDHIREHWYEWRKNNKQYKEYQKQYNKEHRVEINERKKRRRKETWYWAIHLRTNRAIKKLWIRPKICPICWEETRVEAHHPNYEKRNEIIFACNKCHQRIHNWWIECPKDIIDINKSIF